LGNAALAFDGRKNAFANKDIGGSPKVIDLKYTDPAEPERVREFTITFKIAAKVNLFSLHQFLEGKLNYTPQEAIQALDIILRHG
jgi:eukaryotic translation initiation factor 2C